MTAAHVQTVDTRRGFLLDEWPGYKARASLSMGAGKRVHTYLFFHSITYVLGHLQLK